jgi:hypothetical protein
MDPKGNAKQRGELWRACENDEEKQRRYWAMCAKSFALWCNLFAWTYVIYEVKDTGQRVAKTGEMDRPFILYPCQESCVHALELARTAGRDLAVQKSRDMGATWLVIAYGVWLSLFHGSPNGVASRKEDLVDKAGDPDALFTKIDYLVSWMPAWMTGAVERSALHISFPKSGGTIDGESTNKHTFRGGRKHIILLDEAAAMENLAAISRATKDAGMRVFVSTHEEVSHFYEIVTSDRVDVFTLGWWDHPQKGQGRTTGFDQKTGQQEWNSPWLEEQRRTRDPKDLALNVLIRPGGDGSLVFDLATLINQDGMYGCEPYHQGVIRFDDLVTFDSSTRASTWPIASLMFEEIRGWSDLDGVWELWCDLVPDHDGRMRPDQDHGYGFGVDIGDGVGTTPSVISVVDVDTGYKVGKWLSRHTRPEALAYQLYQAAYWWGGLQRVPAIALENNGGRASGILIDLKRWKFPRIYRHQELDASGTVKSDTLGWVSNQRRKKQQLAVYGGSLFRGEFKNPDRAALREARTYIHIRDDEGKGSRVAPKRLGHLPDADLAEHGDIVISDMLADLVRMRAPQLKAGEQQAPYGTVGWAQQEHKKNQDRLGGGLTL